MTKSNRKTDVLSYCTIVGFVLAFFFGARKVSKFHFRQSATLIVAYYGLYFIQRIFGNIPVLGTVVSFVCGLLTAFIAILWLIAILSAIAGCKWKLPVLSNLSDRVIVHFKNIKG